ncbi:MAG: hypothetical protein ABIO99_04350, partial [Candidatus Limnocylindria bacterium]
MPPAGPDGPDPAAPLRTGPHPTAHPSSVTLPRWPGPAMIIVGAVLAIVSLGVAAAAEQPGLAIGDPALFGWLAIFGAALFVAGLLYVAIRQLRVRRHLPPERYRGPAIPLLLVLVFVLASIATAPFARDAAALVLGEGELTFFGSIVILMATQAALLL